MAQEILAPDSRGSCRLHWSKSALSHRCSLKMDRGLPYRGHKLNHFNRKIEVLFCHARPSKSSLSVTMAHASPVCSLLNLLGRMVLSTNWSAPTIKLQKARLNAHLKLLKVDWEGFQVEHWKQSFQGFLLSYRTTPHTTTGVTPVELLMKRKL